MPETSCPQCRQKYRLPDSFAGKKAKCKKCGKIFAVASLQPEPPDDVGFGLFDEIDAATQRAKAKKAIPAASPIPDDLSDLSRAASIRAPLTADPEPANAATPMSRFLKDVVWTFLFPTSAKNLIAFVFAWILFGFLFSVVSFAPCVGAVAWFILLGWYCSYLFNCMETAAGGEEDLPTITLSGGWVEDILLPLARWIGSWVVVLAPAGIVLLASSGSLTEDQIDDMFDGGPLDIVRALLRDVPAAGALLLAGLFFWPLVVLCVSFGGFATLLRIDLILATVFRTFSAYVATALLVLGLPLLVEYLVSDLVVPALTKAAGLTGLFTGAALGLFAIIDLYSDLVAMRTIGHYYHHFKKRFAWEWG